MRHLYKHGNRTIRHLDVVMTHSDRSGRIIRARDSDEEEIWATLESLAERREKYDNQHSSNRR